MDVDHPEDDRGWDRRERGETEVERLDRNWTSLLQELRVVQTGVQLLTGFLLMFRRHRLQVLVSASHRCAYAGLVLLGAALTGATVIIFAAVSGSNTGFIAGACALAMFSVFWLVLALLLRTRGVWPPVRVAVFAPHGARVYRRPCQLRRLRHGPVPD